MPRNLDLALIGNGAIGLLVDSMGTVVWGCFPRFDGDATFCALLDDAVPGEERSIYAVEILDFARAEQSYCTNTAVLVTRLVDKTGGEVEITDCVPRFMQHGRVFHPMSYVRTVRRVAGSPRIRIRLRPAAGYGRAHPAITVGSTRCSSGPTRPSRAPSMRSVGGSSRKRSSTGTTGCDGSRYPSNGRPPSSARRLRSS